MLKTLALAGAAALALSGAAGAQPMHHDMRGGHDMPGMSMSRDFVAQAGASDKFEITEAKLAQTRAHNPKLKHFAAEMIRDHTKSTLKIKAAVKRSMGHAPPPPVLTPDQEQMIATLRAAHGPDFDRTYVEQQVQAHQMALELMTTYAQNGDDPALKHAAAEIQPTVQMHYDMIKGMQDHMH